MRLIDEAAGRRVRCPACKHIFVAPVIVGPGGEELEVIECAVVEEPAERPAPRLSLDDDEEEDRPHRKPRRDDDDEEDDRPRHRGRRDDDEDDRPRRRRRDEDDDRPAKRRRKRSAGDAEAPSGPLILGILSCVFCCIPIVGAILGNMAKNKADEEIHRLPSGRRYEAADRQLQLARTLGTIGVCLSIFMMIVGLIVRIATWNNR
jgi:hypothetical protein